MVVYRRRFGSIDDGFTQEITEKQYNELVEAWKTKHNGLKIQFDGNDYDVYCENKCVGGYYKTKTPRREIETYYESHNGYNMNYKISKTIYAM